MHSECAKCIQMNVEFFPFSFVCLLVCLCIFGISLWFCGASTAEAIAVVATEIFARRHYKLK